MKCLEDPKFSFINSEDRAFMNAFDQAMDERGYGCADELGSGFCWGKYMAVYTPVGAKTKRVAARIYVREESIALRLFFSGIDRHRRDIEAAPESIRQLFMGPEGDCHHCEGRERCTFRKSYTLEGRLIEKCSGSVFTIERPQLSQLGDYLQLFDAFYRRRKGAAGK